MKFTKTQLVDALRKTKGVFAETARILNVSRQAVSKRVHADPKLLAIAEGFREELVDAAEKTLREKVEAGSLKASIFTLTTLGRSRGYGRKLEVEDKTKNRGTIVLIPEGMTTEEAAAQVPPGSGVTFYFPDDGREDQTC
ncbi:hypothetical protein VN12_11670 [Pirellula sp. SH-Sr6A]|uniref:helix-turn-helix domain-containing protein n=1 Tax=Pirellula sp. SH-Sr6A TaxID=1632865 RepID=UPI00078BE2CA|nr:helix-turn-helix domain-containing protein [Pirellula sp. SH-Sr6A]AMV32775.1 hypothetical protein VN12_11670 [Pirellula sp. SH-Sr6A]